MKGHLVFVGHISMDKVRNIHGERQQPGGAALYAALAAKTLFPDVRIVSSVGKDFKYMDILKNFSKCEVKLVDLPSTKFTIEYDDKWRAKYSKAVIGAGMQIKVTSIPITWLTSNTIVHLCPMKPLKVEKMIDRIKRYSPKTKVSVNSWIGYMKNRVNREALRRIASKVDFFIVNEREVKALTRTDSLIHAINLIDCKMLVVTLGELGAIVSTNGEVTMIPALRTATQKVIDTTGAGDCWCGAFLAAYKLTEDISRAITTASIISSIKCSGWGFEKLLKLKFNKVDDVAKYVLRMREKSVQRVLTEFIEAKKTSSSNHFCLKV
ncbi:MAG: carbohydrate kinase family protein [archaeon GB-1867-005]|nr:carbohydrate kinase family protein [Candidatus Culexmicrobium cathedralense]